MKALFRTSDNRIFVKDIPAWKVYVADGKIYVRDADEEEWITLGTITI